MGQVGTKMKGCFGTGIDKAPPVVEIPKTADGAKRRRSGVSSEIPSLKDFQRVVHPKSDEERKHITGSIKSVLLFADTDAAGLDTIVDAMLKDSYKPGQDIISQGDLTAEYFYVIESGDCDVVVDDNVVASLGKGKYFGELALMYNAPRNATIRAKGKVVCWKLDRATFIHIRVHSRAEALKEAEGFLEEIEILKPLTKDQRSRIADVLSFSTFQPKDVVIKEGDKGEVFYIVESGTAEATKNDGKSQKTVKHYKRGDYFGELALLKNEPRAANVIATGKDPLKCLTLDKPAFDRVLGDLRSILDQRAKDYPQVAQKYMS